MKKFTKETSIIILALILAGCFVSGFATSFSFFGKFSNIIGIIILLILADKLIKHENKMSSTIDTLERANRTLQEKLDDAREELEYYHEKERAGD